MSFSQKFGHLDAQLAQFPVLTKWMSQRVFPHHRLQQFIVWFHAKLTEMEQNMGALAARVLAIETGAVLPPASLDPLQDVGPCLGTLVAPLLPGPVTQVLWTTTEICDDKSKQNPDDDNSRSAVLLRFPCAQSRAWRLRLARQRISRIGERVRCERLGVSWSLMPCANSSWHNTRMIANSIQLPVFFATIQRQCLSANPKSEEARDVGRRFAPLWKALNGRLRADFKDNDDTVRTIDVLFSDS